VVITGRFLDIATFLSLVLIAFQYSWNNFLKGYYYNRVKQRIEDEAKARTKVEHATKKLQKGVLVFLILAITLAVIDILGGDPGRWLNLARN